MMPFVSTRHKHTLVHKAGWLDADGQQCCEALMWGGDEKGHTDADAIAEASKRCECLSSLCVAIGLAGSVKQGSPIPTAHTSAVKVVA